MTDNFKSQRGTDANAGVQTNASVQTGSAPASCKVGIDIGSTTIKVVVLDAENRFFRSRDIDTIDDNELFQKATEEDEEK